MSASLPVKPLYEHTQSTDPALAGQAAALVQSADALARRGRPQEAAACLERALQLRPEQAALWNRLGGLRHALGQFEFSLAAADRVVSLRPTSSSAWSNRGLALDALWRAPEALESFERALACDASIAPLWCNCAKALNDLGRFEESLACLDRALELAPNLALAWSGRSVPLRARGRMEEALAACERAVALDPASAVGWGQKGWILLDIGRYESAHACLQRTLELAPENSQARYNLGLLHLTQGRFAEGWEGYEARTSVLKISGLRLSRAPMWLPGQPIAGKTVALHSEQGLGDVIQFCRYAPLLAAQGAQVLLVVPPTLHRLLRCLEDSSRQGIRVLSAGDAMPAFDLQCWLLSVAHQLGTLLQSVPSQLPYLAPPAPVTRFWQQRLGLQEAARVPRRRFGIVCCGSPTHPNDRNRSVALQEFAPLLAQFPAPQYEWHLLQSELRGADEPWLERLGIVDHRAQLHDFCETAALAACMDAVVSVDTSVAHLAGALAVPLYLLLPANPDWRWMLEREDSPWYPGARLFRQHTAGDWGPAIARLAAALWQRGHC